MLTAVSILLAILRASCVIFNLHHVQNDNNWLLWGNFSKYSLALMITYCPQCSGIRAAFQGHFLAGKLRLQVTPHALVVFQASVDVSR